MAAPSPTAPEAPKSSERRPSTGNRLPRPPSPRSFVEVGDAEDLAPLIEIEFRDLEFKESVGTGITAEVFRGYWQGKEVAIKQINMQRKDGRSTLKQQVAFSREVAILSQVKFPQLVEFFGVCFQDRMLCVITEYCSGACLFDLLHNNEDIDIVWPQKLKMAVDVAKAMHYLHNFEPQIIHRDLKSLNILLALPITTPEDVPVCKVSDMGLARMKDLDAEWEKMTKAAGTCHWMAPEVLTGRYDTKADVYSYSMVLFEIICREIPFEDMEGGQVVDVIVQGKRPDLEAVPPDCPDALCKLMRTCWRASPADRPDFGRILHELDGVRLPS